MATQEGANPIYAGIENVLKEKQTEVRVFGKPTTRPYRRMAVVLVHDSLQSNVDEVKEKAIRLAKEIVVRIR